ncbi:hypothetical protein CDAR_201461 [Caerostris darwini]|nr:hypothetical protein CDAR_201461 [Caerostris darwini]
MYNLIVKRINNYYRPVNNERLKGRHSNVKLTTSVQHHHDSLAQKVELNHSYSHQLRCQRPPTRPLAIIRAALEVCCLVFMLVFLKQVLKVVD